jgi:hypothetical protein
MHKDDMPGKDWNMGHPDHEGEMAVAQLHRIAEMAQELLEMIGENDELQGWIQYKISRAFNDINDAYNYVEAQDHMHGDTGCKTEEMMGEGRKKKKGLWHNIHKRRKAGKKPKRPGEKGYPKTLKIESGAQLGNLISEIMKGKI